MGQPEGGAMRIYPGNGATGFRPATSRTPRSPPTSSSAIGLWNARRLSRHAAAAQRRHRWCSTPATARAGSPAAADRVPGTGATTGCCAVGDVDRRRAPRPGGPGAERPARSGCSRAPVDGLRDPPDYIATAWAASTWPAEPADAADCYAAAGEQPAGRPLLRRARAAHAAGSGCAHPDLRRRSRPAVPAASPGRPGCTGSRR